MTINLHTLTKSHVNVLRFRQERSSSLRQRRGSWQIKNSNDLLKLMKNQQNSSLFFSSLALDRKFNDLRVDITGKVTIFHSISKYPTNESHGLMQIRSFLNVKCGFFRSHDRSSLANFVYECIESSFIECDFFLNGNLVHQLVIEVILWDFYAKF